MLRLAIARRALTDADAGAGLLQEATILRKSADLIRPKGFGAAVGLNSVAIRSSFLKGPETQALGFARANQSLVCQLQTVNAAIDTGQSGWYGPDAPVGWLQPPHGGEGDAKINLPGVG